MLKLLMILTVVALVALPSQPLAGQDAPTVTLADTVTAQDKELAVALDLTSLEVGESWRADVYGGAPAVLIDECNGARMGESQEVEVALTAPTTVGVATSTCPIATGYVVQLEVDYNAGTISTYTSETFEVRAAEPEWGDEVYFTLDLPSVEHRVANDILTLAVKPVVGSQETHVVINNTLPYIRFDAGRLTATSTPELFTLSIEIPDSDSRFMSYSVRGSTYAGESALRLHLDRDAQYLIPSQEYAYTAFTSPRYAARIPLAPVPLPPGLQTPIPADKRLTLGIRQVLDALPTGTADSVDEDSLSTTLVFLIAVVLGGIAGVGFQVAPGLNGMNVVVAGVGLGVAVFALVWFGVGSTVGGLPYTVTVPPLLLPFLVAGIGLKGKL